MIKHLVMWKVSGDSNEQRTAAAEKIKVEFEGLMGKIAGLEFVEVGINFSKNPEAYDVVLCTHFADSKALAGYAMHPEHLGLRERLAGLRLDRCEVDYQLEG